MQVWAEQLHRLLPSDLPPSERETMFLNILLVKFGLRPATLLDLPFEDMPQLVEASEFWAWWNADPELRAGWFATETPEPELWMYHAHYEDRFLEPDVSDRSEEEIQETRRRRLGFPCSGKEYLFLLERKEPALEVTISSSEGYRYGYWCRNTSFHAHEAVVRWEKFRSFAEKFHIKLILTLNVRRV